MTLSPRDRHQARRYFVICLCNLPHFELYWLPTARRLTARSVMVARRFTLPQDALLIGTYSQPCDPEDFLGDFEDALALDGAAVPDGILPRDRRRRAHAGGT